MNRFITPSWVKEHWFDYNGVDSLDAEKIEEIRIGLSKFNTEEPLVSIVIPVWNEEKNLARTLSSFSKMKTNHVVELIIVNNNSTDRTQELIDLLGVKSIFQPVQSISLTRQAGLEAAKGKYHLCADGDSIYPPSWIDTYVEALQNENVSCVYGRHSFIPEKGSSRIFLGMHELIAESLFDLRKKNREYLNVLGFNFGFRTEDAKSVGGFNTNRKRWSDGWMAMTLSKIGKVRLLKTGETRVWTSSRRLLADGSLSRALINRVKKEVNYLTEYIFNTQPKKV